MEGSVYTVSRTTETLIGNGIENTFIAFVPYFFNFNITAGNVNIYNISIGYGSSGYYIFNVITPSNTSSLLFENCIIFEAVACL
jgi:hypothetical protein